MPETDDGPASGWAREQADEDPAGDTGMSMDAAVSNSNSDEQLMLAFCGGDSASFEALFLRYQQPVFGFFRRRMPDPRRAEELTQECFLAILRAAERYRAEASFRTFLYAVALNLLRADRRKAAFRAMWSASPPETEPADTRGDAEAGMVLRDALRRLEPQDREVLMLRTYEELSYAEIAELLRMPVNTVRSRLFRARTALREVLTAPRPTMQERATAMQGKERV